MGFSGSDVYASNEKLEVEWKAELPHPSDIFANSLIKLNDGDEMTTCDGCIVVSIF